MCCEVDGKLQRAQRRVEPGELTYASRLRHGTRMSQIEGWSELCIHYVKKYSQWKRKGCRLSRSDKFDDGTVVVSSQNREGFLTSRIVFN